MSNNSYDKPTSYLTLPSFLRDVVNGNKPLIRTLSDINDSNIESTSSFRFDPHGTPIKSSQQLNVDWSNFENHCFFMSAEALVNTTFEKIINNFPFDGSKKEIESFFDSMTGFEKWLYNQFPKYTGSLTFSSNLENYIQVNDKTGLMFPELSKVTSGISVLNPGTGSFSIDTHIFIPQIVNDVQVICQKLNPITNCGFTLYLSSSLLTSSVDLCFAVVSGSSNIDASIQLNKGEYKHIVATLDNSRQNAFINLYLNAELISTSRKNNSINEMAINDCPLYIASGTAWTLNSSIINPIETFSGSLDDFKFYHSSIDIETQRKHQVMSTAAENNLKLYFKFNEPPPPLVANELDSINAIVLDSSGNALHSIIQNFTGSLRSNSSTLLEYEQVDLSPVLFPAYNDIITLNTNLLTSASLYDDVNPNLITKLVPDHWILQGQSYEAFTDQYGNINSQNLGSGIPGQGEFGSTHMILSFLYMYARFFDELKLYHDQFASLKHVSYDQYDTTPSTFLYDTAKTFGLELPPLFNESSIEQYVYAENLDNEISIEPLPLRTIQDELLKRVLVNMPKIIRSKGTIYAIKAFLRSMGIDPETSVRIREMGGPKVNVIGTAVEHYNTMVPMLYLTTSSLIKSPFLISDRIEPGEPYIAGNFIDGKSNNANDGLLTSGSWTFEAHYKWGKNIKHLVTQSLCRLCVTGSNVSNGGIIANLVAYSSSLNSTIKLHLRPGNNPEAPYDVLTLTTNNYDTIFDGEKWLISFGYKHKDDDNNLLSGSYFIRFASQNGDNIKQYVTSSFIYNIANVVSTDNNVFNAYNFTLSSSSINYQITPNASGTFIEIGNNLTNLFGLNNHITGDLYLNNINKSTDDARCSNLECYLSNVRFWSNYITDLEFNKHIQDYRNVGVINPQINYDLNTTESGSFKRLRLDAIYDQNIKTPTNNNITLFDRSSMNFHLSGSGFNNVTTFINDTFERTTLSPYFDEPNCGNKIKIRSAKSFDIVSLNDYTNFAPVYNTPQYETITNDSNFSIDFSLIDALNQDMITLFSTLDAIGDAIGTPEAMFSYDYSYISNLRDIYFKQISGVLNFKAFFDFFQWFDNSIGTFVEQLLPHKTNFKGINFLIESHIFERHKIVYHNEESYLLETDRKHLNDTLLLQQITGVLSKY